MYVRGLVDRPLKHGLRLRCTYPEMTTQFQSRGGIAIASFRRRLRERVKLAESEDCRLGSRAEGGSTVVGTDNVMVACQQIWSRSC